MPFHTENGIFFALFSQNTCTVQKHPLSLHPQTRNKGVIAQLVEQRTENPCVPGSIPGDTTFGEASECSAVGSALRSGRRGRAFESPHSDTQKHKPLDSSGFFVLMPLKRPRNARTGFLPSHHRQPTPLLLSASLSIPAKNTTEKASYTGPGKDKQRKTELFMQEIEHICRKIQKKHDGIAYYSQQMRNFAPRTE